MALSKRGTSWAQPDDSMLLWTVVNDLWDPQTNPHGYASLGIAENTLMHDTLSKHMRANFNPPNTAFTYGDGPRGTKRLRTAMAKFLTKHLKPLTRITPEHIAITNGCSSALEHIAFLLANPGEAFLLGQPHYGAFTHDLALRSETSVQTVAFGHVDPFSLEAVQAYEETLLTSHREGRRIAGLVLCTPHNPLGRCYPRETLVALMRLCENYQIHFIADEIYALSVWKNSVDNDPPPVPFESCLSINTSGIIDPSRIHLIWGTSKDFGANGLRLGAIISQHNAKLHNAVLPGALFSSASSLAEHVTANVLEDDDFVETYLAENKRRLAEHYSLITTWAKEHNITYAPGASAAFFLWVDLGAAYLARNPGRKVVDVTAEVMDALLKQKIFLASGKQFGSERTGWFRIVFSHPRELLFEGLERVIKALETKNERVGKPRL